MEERLWTVETKIWELTTEEVKTYLCHTEGHTIDAQKSQVLHSQTFL